MIDVRSLLIGTALGLAVGGVVGVALEPRLGSGIPVAVEEQARIVLRRAEVRCARAAPGVGGDERWICEAPSSVATECVLVRSGAFCTTP